uniref:Uncharacterized protein n=1 Tax=Cannabis sativa TaxID=3483 RepID=A0A803R0L0_CANSA
MAQLALSLSRLLPQIKLCLSFLSQRNQLTSQSPPILTPTDSTHPTITSASHTTATFCVNDRKRLKASLIKIKQATK